MPHPTPLRTDLAFCTAFGALAALAWHLAVGTHAWIVGIAAATGIALTLTPDRWKQRRRSR